MCSPLEAYRCSEPADHVRKRTGRRSAGRRRERQSEAVKRLLLISSHFPPDGAAGTHRVMRFTTHLYASGWDVSVLTMDPAYYLSGTQTDERLLAAIPGDIHIYRTKALRGVTALIRLRNRLSRARRASQPPPATLDTGGARHASPSRRLKDAFTDLCAVPDRDVGWLWYAVRRGAQIIRRNGIDVILSSAPPFTCHVVADVLRGMYGRKWVADFRDPWSRSPWATPERAAGWRGAVHRWLERRTVEHADAVILNTKRMHAEFTTYYGPSNARKFHTVTNGYDLELLQPYINTPKDHAGPLTLTHAGSFYRDRQPAALLTALASVIRQGRIPTDGILLHFVGAIAPRFEVPALISQLRLESVVRLTPPVPHHESLRSLSQSDVLLVVQPGTSLQVPVKLYEYMAFGKPILALADRGAVADLVDEGRLGLVVPPEDVTEIGNALCMLYEHRNRLSELFQPDEAYVKSFEGKILSMELQKILERI